MSKKKVLKFSILLLLYYSSYFNVCFLEKNSNEKHFYSRKFDKKKEPKAVSINVHRHAAFIFETLTQKKLFCIRACRVNGGGEIILF